MKPNSRQSKHLFIGLSLLSVSSLVGSFAGPLLPLEIYQQKEPGIFNAPVTRTYVITSATRVMPYGFMPSKAKLIAQVHQPYTVSKLLLLATAIGSSVVALSIGKDSLSHWENEDALRALEAQGSKELREKAIKHSFAMKEKLQHHMFADEIRAMINSFGSEELEAMEVNDLLLEESEPEPSVEEATQEEPSVQDTSLDFRGQFHEVGDGSTWKLIVKSLGDGYTKQEVITQVLGGGPLAEAYFEHLKSKYL